MSSEPVVDLPPSPDRNSPDRKRSLEDESSSEDDETRGGRFKRQALNSSDSAHPSPAKRDGSAEAKEGNPTEYPPGTEPPAQGENMVSSQEEGTANKVMAMRAIITAKEAGIVIGKNGRNVADIREKSGAKVTVSEQVPGALERIITITGPLDTVAKAFSLVALKIVEEQQTPVELKQRHTAIRILVPHSRMGSIIGKQGQKIKDVQDASGSRVMANEDILPQSTERIVTVQGVVDSVHIATYHIGLVLQDHPERSMNTIAYRPLPGVSTVQAGNAQRGGGGGGPSNMPPMMGGGGYSGQHMGGGGGYGPGGGGMNPPGYGYGGGPPGGHMGGGMHGGMPHQMPRPGPPGMAPVMPPQGAMQMQQIFIPNEMVGAIIGKGGTKINEIRQMSGCQIKIAEPTEGAAERLVTITGTPETNQVALYMLYQRLESEKMRMSTGGR
ncbi:hypothetical protein HDU67_009255 [Dinochytrium kinnereticum]|nr:hypothetical protein HDU67_009255 [Dinochytrium kinnereticum]